MYLVTCTPMEQAKKLFRKFLFALKSRLARNGYFWGLILWTKLEGVSTYTPYSTATYIWFVIAGMCFFAFLSYFTTLVLAPWLISKKRYWTYAGIAFATAFIVAFIYTFWMKYILHLYPGLEVGQFSMVMYPMEDSLSAESVFNDMQTTCSVMVVWTFCFTLLWFVNDYSKQEKRAEEALKKQTETELNFLKHQINPHFLFNTLNNLYGLTLQKSDHAPDAILKLSSLMRYMLYESNSPLASFEKEKEMIQAYIDIEMLRLGENHNMNFSISSSGTREIPPLLWLPVLENIFKHGISHKKDLFIDFRFSLQDDHIHIYSKNHASVYKNGLEQGKGIGIDNLRKRLELLYPGKHQISISQDEQFYSIDVNIHLS